MTNTPAAGFRYRELAINDAQDLVFGIAARPLDCGFGLRIGGGLVFPEVNFTLPALEVNASTWSEVLGHYREIAAGVIRRALALQVPGMVLEFELLPAMTETPEWGAEITALLHTALRDAHEKHGLRSALRVTPTDIREQAKPPLLREGPSWERLRRSFDLCIAAGADILSIESIGGKELHDYGLMYGDFRAIVCALGVLAPRDMAWLWDRIVAACAASPRAIPGGDTACGFANTAMQLAHQKMLPEVLAAVVRAMSAARSLVAFEHGARGPSKDCAYEGPVLKAITGCPISMEGKSAACAHFSPLGNIASAMCDLWSNESVQNIRLLSGNAPEAFAELLAYDCRLMNTATKHGQQSLLRDWLTESDEHLSPQALLLSPASTLRLARAIVSLEDDYGRTVAAGREAVAILNQSQASGELVLPAREKSWLSRLAAGLEGLPPAEDALLTEMIDQHGDLFDCASYGLAPRPAH
ncbi:MAG: methyltransferase MtaB domain-containing protein [Bryobacteraceae bacterium]